MATGAPQHRAARAGEGCPQQASITDLLPALAKLELRVDAGWDAAALAALLRQQGRKMLKLSRWLTGHQCVAQLAQTLCVAGAGFLTELERRGIVRQEHRWAVADEIARAVRDGRLHVGEGEQQAEFEAAAEKMPPET